MRQKLTISEFRQYVQEQAIKMYKNYLKENMEVAAEPSVEQQIHDEIEMRMRPSDNTLPFDEINDIAEEHGVDVEYVAQIMTDYLSKRNQTQNEELKDLVQFVIDTDFNGEAPDFKTFYMRFLDYDDSVHYGPENITPVKKMFAKLTTDPNQLKMFEQLLREGLKDLK